MTAITFQTRVQPWLLACFGAEIAADRAERNHRFLEESLELVQACGCSASEAHQLVDYVFGRPVGEPAQEAGGVMVTLAALCLPNSLDMHEAGETELARIWTKVEAIRAKQAAKPKHSPLPAAPAAVAPQGERPHLTEEQWYDLASRHATVDWNGNGFLDAVKTLCTDFAGIVSRQPSDAAPALEAPPGVAGRTTPRNDDERAAAQFFADNPSAALLAWPLYLARDKSTALEAPAAPAGDEETAFTKWFQGEQGKPYQGMWEFARAAWMARAASAGMVAAALTRLDAIYREEADCDEPPQRPDWLVNALHLAAAAPQAPAQAVAHRMLRKNGAGEWVHDAKFWANGPAPAELVADVAKHSDRYCIEHAYSSAAPQAPAAPAEGLEALLNEALAEVRRIVDTEQVSLAPTFHNAVRRPNDKRKFHMGDARRAARNAAAALEKAFDVMIAGTVAAPAAPSVNRYCRLNMCVPADAKHDSCCSSAAGQAAPAAPAVDAALPSWWPDFIQCVAELPDRNSPEDEPDAMIATAEELGACAIAAQAQEGGAS